MCCPLWEYTGFVTRQLTGAVPLPSSLLVKTVSMIVPSRSGWSGPVGLMASVRSGGPLLHESRRSGYHVTAAWAAAARCRSRW